MNVIKFFKASLISVPASLLLAACAANRPMGVPSSATIIDSGSDYLAMGSPAPGKVWVVEPERDDRVVYTGTLARNWGIAVDPDAGAITVNGKTVSQGLAPGVKREIFFLSSAPSDSYDGN
jgi:hypothetical protein